MLTFLNKYYTSIIVLKFKILNQHRLGQTLKNRKIAGATQNNPTHLG